MTEEEKAVEEAQKAAAEQKAVEEAAQAAALEQEEEVVEEVDYQEVLQKLKKTEEERDNYKKGLLKAKGKLPKEEQEEVEEEKPDIGTIVREAVQKELQTFKVDQSKTSIESILSEMAKSDAEKELIRHYYENYLVKSGFDSSSIREDLENAKLLANKKTFLKKSKEMSIASQAKPTNSGQGSNQERDKEVTTDTFFSPEQLKTLKDKGLDPAKIKATMQKQVAKGYKLE